MPYNLAGSSVNRSRKVIQGNSKANHVVLRRLTAVLQIRGVRVPSCPQLSHLTCITRLKSYLNQKANSRVKGPSLRQRLRRFHATLQHFSTTLKIAHTLSQKCNTRPTNPGLEAGSNRKGLRKPRDQSHDGLAGRLASLSLWHVSR